MRTARELCLCPQDSYVNASHKAGGCPSHLQLSCPVIHSQLCSNIAAPSQRECSTRLMQASFSLAGRCCQHVQSGITHHSLHRNGTCPRPATPCGSLAVFACKLPPAPYHLGYPVLVAHLKALLTSHSSLRCLWLLLLLLGLCLFWHPLIPSSQQMVCQQALRTQ